MFSWHTRYVWSMSKAAALFCQAKNFSLFCSYLLFYPNQYAAAIIPKHKQCWCSRARSGACLRQCRWLQQHTSGSTTIISATTDCISSQLERREDWVSRHDYDLVLSFKSNWPVIVIIMGQNSSLLKLDTFSQEEISRLEKRFQKLDLDRSGSISVGEFVSVPELKENPLVKRVVDIFDSDLSGEIDFKGM